MTRLLLDAHLLLWWLNDDPRLPSAVVERVQAPEAEVFVSQASLWEMAIKVSIGRLRVDLLELERLGARVHCQLSRRRTSAWNASRRSSSC